MNTHTQTDPSLHAPVGATPCARMGDARAYLPPRKLAHIDLRLDSNERQPDTRLLTQSLSAIGMDDVAHYPSAAALESVIADRLGVSADRVLLTAGGDEAIERACRGYLEPGRELLITTPTFEMIAKSARLAGARVREFSWESGPFPTDAMIAGASSSTGMLAVVTPNNPTGAVASGDDLRRMSAAAPGALLLVDLAYTEFADEDLTRAALALPNALVVRTFSKAWGFAGLRVGYAAGPADVIRTLRAAGGPYTVSAASIAMVRERLARGGEDVAAYVARVRIERTSLERSLRSLGAGAIASQGNFVLGRFRDARWIADALASLGIGVRRFGEPEALHDRLRITCPGSTEGMERLTHALETASAPEALLFDMDGVLADVSRSYRAAIIGTARQFGVELTDQDIAQAKAAGNANNDWILTRRLLEERGIVAPLRDVTDQFEALYVGADAIAGLRDTEALLASRELLAALAARVRLGVVTGRPRRDCERFLKRFGIDDLFRACVCMEDGPAKPDPTPVRKAMEVMGVRRAWLIGDTPDDVVAARRAGVVSLGIVAPGVESNDMAGAASVLREAGTARVLGRVDELVGLLEGSTCLGL